LVNELYMLREIKQQGVIKLYEIFENDQYISLVMEQSKGVPLSVRIKSKEGYCEGDAAKIVKSLMTTVNGLHELNIIHRDIHIENLIVMYNNIFIYL